MIDIYMLIYTEPLNADLLYIVFHYSRTIAVLNGLHCCKILLTIYVEKNILVVRKLKCTISYP